METANSNNATENETDRAVENSGAPKVSDCFADLDRLAALAHLSLTEDEKQRLSPKIAALLRSAKKLRDADTDCENAEKPEDMPEILRGGMRGDLPEEKESFPPEDGYFTVERIIF